MSGVWPVYQIIRTIEVDRGRLISDEDNREARRVVVIGHEMCKQLFADRDAIGQQIGLNGIPYTIVGRVRKKEQDSNYTGADNNRMFMPYETMRKDFPMPGSQAHRITSRPSSPRLMNGRDELNSIVEREGKINFEKIGPVEIGRSVRSQLRVTVSTRLIVKRFRCGTRRSKRFSSTR